MDEIRRFRAHFADVDGKEMRFRIQRPQNHSPKSQHSSHSYFPVSQGAGLTKDSLMASQKMGISGRDEVEITLLICSTTALFSRPNPTMILELKYPIYFRSSCRTSSCCIVCNVFFCRLCMFLLDHPAT